MFLQDISFNITIQSCWFAEGQIGIGCANVSRVIIKESTFTLLETKAINILNCPNTLIEDNEFLSCGAGIYLEYCLNASVISNTFGSVDGFAVKAYFSNECNTCSYY